MSQLAKETGHALETGGIHGKFGLGLFDGIDRWDSVRAAYDAGGMKAGEETAAKEGAGWGAGYFAERFCGYVLPGVSEVLIRIAPEALIAAPGVEIVGVAAVIVAQGACAAAGDTVGKIEVEKTISMVSHAFHMSP